MRADDGRSPARWRVAAVVLGLAPAFAAASGDATATSTAEWTIAALVAVAALLAAPFPVARDAGEAPGEGGARSVRTVEACVFGLAALAWVQAVPLPRGVVGLLSSEAAALRDALVPGGPAETWRPLSLSPADTVVAAWRLTLAAVALSTGRRIAARGRAAVSLLAGSVAAGVVAVAAGSLLVPAGADPVSRRLHGPFADPNALAAFVVGGAFAVAAAVAAGTGGGALPAWRGGRVAPTLAAAAGLGVLLVALGRTASRLGAASLGLAAVVAAAGAARGPARAGRRLVVAAAVAVVLGGVALFGVDPLLAERSGALIDGGASAFAARGDALAAGVAAAREFPLTGIGIGASPVALPALREPGSGPPWSHAHGEPVQLLLDGGPAALLLGLTAVLAWLRATAPAAGGDAGAPWGSAALRGAGVALLLHSVADHPVRAMPVALLVAVLAGAAVGRSRGPRAPAGAGSEPPAGERCAHAPSGLAGWVRAAAAAAVVVAPLPWIASESRPGDRPPAERAKGRPLDPSAHLAVAREAGGSRAAAAAALDRAERAAGARDGVWLAVADGRLRLSPPDPDGAVRAWRQAIRVHPGWTRRLLERLEGVDPGRDPAAVVPPESARAMLELARYHRDRGREAEARAVAASLTADALPPAERAELLLLRAPRDGGR